jgi:hypothetical protein
LRRAMIERRHSAAVGELRNRGLGGDDDRGGRGNGWVDGSVAWKSEIVDGSGCEEGAKRNEKVFMILLPEARPDCFSQRGGTKTFQLGLPSGAMAV